jgi:hypothetical protein
LPRVFWVVFLYGCGVYGFLFVCGLNPICVGS